VWKNRMKNINSIFNSRFHDWMKKMKCFLKWRKNSISRMTTSRNFKNQQYTCKTKYRTHFTERLDLSRYQITWDSSQVWEQRTKTWWRKIIRAFKLNSWDLGCILNLKQFPYWILTLIEGKGNPTIEWRDTLNEENLVPEQKENSQIVWRRIKDQRNDPDQKFDLQKLEGIHIKSTLSEEDLKHKNSKIEFQWQDIKKLR
jgi:hypothetical protein